MGHRNITISDRAYEELARRKRTKESFTDVILRLTSDTGSAAALLAFMEKLPPSEELAKNIEITSASTRKAALRRAAVG